MQSLGLIETRGLLPAIESVDVMLKTAQVELMGRIFVGGGLVTIAVTGDVGAVKAAVEAGAAAAQRMGSSSLVSQHVIPRPHDDIESMIVTRVPIAISQECLDSVQESHDASQVVLNYISKVEVDAFVQQFGLAKGVYALQSLPVVKLRNLAREYKELDIVGRAISKANKELLIQKLTGYYERGSSNK